MNGVSDFRSPNPLQPWTGTFAAPTSDEAMATPGFQFQLGQGLQALQRSAAAKGTLLTGGAQKGLEQYAVGLANQNYGDVYNRAYNTYESNRNSFLQNEANRYNSERSNLTDQWGINSDYFNMGQAQKLNDFHIWDASNPASYSNILKAQQVLRPVSPLYPGYTG